MTESTPRFRWTKARFIVLIVLLHVIYAVTFVPYLRGHSFDRGFERHVVTVSLVFAASFYALWVILSVAWAERNRFNLALAFQKWYWFLLIVLLALPANTDAWAVAPNWVRVYIWSGIALATPWVVYELARVNKWDEHIADLFGRRRRGSTEWHSSSDA